jgi:hypothetical protein
MAETLTVACKMPQGIIARVFEMVDFDEPVMGGGVRTVQRARQLGDPVTIKGFAVPQGHENNAPGGYALTYGVDAEFFNKWLEQNAETAMIKKGLIFAMSRTDSATSKAKEQAKLKSGLDRLDPENLPIKRVKSASTSE